MTGGDGTQPSGLCPLDPRYPIHLGTGQPGTGPDIFWRTIRLTRWRHAFAIDETARAVTQAAIPQIRYVQPVTAPFDVPADLKTRPAVAAALAPLPDDDTAARVAKVYAEFEAEPGPRHWWQMLHRRPALEAGTS